MYSSCNTTQTTGGLPLLDPTVSRHLSTSIIVHEDCQMYCILTKYTEADQMLKFVGGRTYISRRIYGGDKKLG